MNYLNSSVTLSLLFILPYLLHPFPIHLTSFVIPEEISSLSFNSASLINKNTHYFLLSFFLSFLHLRSFFFFLFSSSPLFPFEKKKPLNWAIKVFRKCRKSRPKKKTKTWYISSITNTNASSSSCITLLSSFFFKGFWK